MVHSGYACVPYLHNHESAELKESWVRSKNIESLFFVTGTFSEESKSYFLDSANNHYLLAKFKDNSKISSYISSHNQSKTSFVFSIKDDLFEREVEGKTNFVSVYYLEYGGAGEDLQEVANLLLKREKIGKAGVGRMTTHCTNPPKFTFPYHESMVVIEVASEKSHQSVKKYCEQTRREINRKGITMTNLMSLSLLDQLK